MLESIQRGTYYPPMAMVVEGCFISLYWEEGMPVD
jgi:hypothetical protein